MLIWAPRSGSRAREARIWGAERNPEMPDCTRPKPVAGQVQPVVAIAKTPLETLIESSINSVALIQGKNSQGTGFVIEPHVIATNRHVIAGEPIDALSVHFPKEPTSFKAKLIYEDDLQDLAFLRVEATAKPLVLCDGCTCRPGQEIVAIGNPGLGGLVLQNTVSKGLMSSDITIEGHSFYQLSISINPGNSGGPVLDSAGQVVGVTTLKATKNEGVAFCIPASEVRAAYVRAQTLSPQDISLVEYKHRALLTQDEHASTKEGLASLKLEERFDLDPVLRGNWRLHATSKDHGETVDESSGGVLFAQAAAKMVKLFGGKRMQINTVYICHDDNGDPGNLVLFSTGVLWMKASSASWLIWPAATRCSPNLPPCLACSASASVICSTVISFARTRRWPSSIRTAMAPSAGT